MTRRDTEIQYIESGTEYGPAPYGQFVGQPTVSLKLSSSEQNSINVNSLENIFSRHGWKKKLRSGHARLRVYGDDAFDEKHEEALEFLFDVLDVRFIDIELKDLDINSEPSRFIKRRADTYTFVFDLSRDEKGYDEDIFERLNNQCVSQGNGQYIFKSDSTVHEDDIHRFCRQYGVYQSDVWVYPKGRKASIVEENRETVTNYAKRNAWNVSPRFNVTYDFPEEE